MTPTNPAQAAGLPPPAILYDSFAHNLILSARQL